MPGGLSLRVESHPVSPANRFVEFPHGPGIRIELSFRDHSGPSEEPSQNRPSEYQVRGKEANPFLEDRNDPDGIPISQVVPKDQRWPVKAGQILLAFQFQPKK